MIDVSELSYQEIQNLKKQIEEYDNSKKGLRGYKVQFIILYNPNGREDQDIADEGSFGDWITDVLSDNITKSFGLYPPEDVILDYAMKLDDGEIADLTEDT